jgi:hypothetical protein
MDPSYPVVAEDERTIKRSYSQSVSAERYQIELDQTFVFVPSDARKIRSFLRGNAGALFRLDNSTTNSHLMIIKLKKMKMTRVKSLGQGDLRP